MKLKLTKLDKRYNGNGQFSHRVEFIGDWKSRAANFVRARNMLSQQFGPSAELTHIHVYDERPLWAWESEHERRVIYLTGGALTQFLLIKDQFEKDYR